MRRRLPESPERTQLLIPNSDMSAYLTAHLPWFTVGEYGDFPLSPFIMELKMHLSHKQGGKNRKRWRTWLDSPLVRLTNSYYSFNVKVGDCIHLSDVFKFNKRERIYATAAKTSTFQ